MVPRSLVHNGTLFKNDSVFSGRHNVFDKNNKQKLVCSVALFFVLDSDFEDCVQGFSETLMHYISFTN